MARRRSSPYRESVKGCCGHVCSAWPQHLRNGIKTVICDYCTRDRDSDTPVWVVVKPGETEVLRKLSTPRPKKAPEATIPLFDPEEIGEVPF